ncbi:metal ABC transporter solute-binding protein, Zn/Mn family [Nakamurella sp. GG22]
MRTRLRASLIAVAAVAGMALTACGSDAPAAGGAGGSADGASPVPVVTSTNVWGDVVEQVGGDQVSVTALVSDPAADPHSFEPTAQAQLAVSKAGLVVTNGGGYDDWATTMVDASNAGVPVIDAVAVSGKDHQDDGTTASSQAPGSDAASTSEDEEHGELNEHVWYDLPSVAAVAEQVSAELTAIRPDKATYFQENTAAFTGKLDGLAEKIGAIKAAHGGTPVAITEPVPLYLTEAAGLPNKTPDQFSEAIEQGTDVPPLVLADTVALVQGKQVAALIYNEQTSSPETQEVQSAAQAAGVAVVPVTETLPAGTDFVSWMDGTITALADALGS